MNIEVSQAPGIALLRHWWTESSPFVTFIFLSFLLIGGDLLAVRAGGMTIRAVSASLIGAILLMLVNKWTIAFDRALMTFFLMLCIAGALSCVTSYDSTRSIGYTFWVLFDFFVIVTLFFNFARQYPIETTRRLWFTVYRITVLLLFPELVMGVVDGQQPRVHLWFYESSYLAVFLAGYFISSLYLLANYGRRYAFDTALAAVGLLLPASATALFAMVFSLVLVAAVSRHRLKMFLYGAVIFGVFFGALSIWFRDTPYYQLLFGFFTGEDVLTAILARGGNRWVRFLIGWEAFLAHPWFGIGIGADSTYMDSHPFSDRDWQYITPLSYLDEVGQPFINITIEVLGTMGIIGFLPYAGLAAYVASCVTTMRVASEDEAFVRALFLAFIVTFMVLQAESTFLRFYLWSPLGLAMGGRSLLRKQGLLRFRILSRREHE